MKDSENIEPMYIFPDCRGNKTNCKCLCNSEIAKLKTIFDMGFYNPIKLLAKSNSFIGVNMLSVADHQPEIIKYCLIKLVELAKNKKIKPVIAKVFKAEEISSAHEMMENGIYKGKIVVKW